MKIDSKASARDRLMGAVSGDRVVNQDQRTLAAVKQDVIMAKTDGVTKGGGSSSGGLLSDVRALFKASGKADTPSQSAPSAEQARQRLRGGFVNLVL